jgi:hypothetical protein
MTIPYYTVNMIIDIQATNLHVGYFHYAVNGSVLWKIAGSDAYEMRNCSVNLMSTGQYCVSHVQIPLANNAGREN